MEEPLGDDERETFGLEPEEAQNIRADLEDLEGMRRTFQAQGVKGVVIVCERCEENHYYEWELLVENLEHMLQTGESQMHEPAFEVRRRGGVVVHAAPDNRVEVTRCPWCETPAEDHFRFCPSCGRSFAAVRVYKELVDRGLDEREVRAMLVRAGFEPF